MPEGVTKPCSPNNDAYNRGGTLRLVLFEKYLLPRKKPRSRAHFVRADQGNKMQSLVRFFTGWKVVFVLYIFDRLLIFLNHVVGVGFHKNVG